MLVAFERGFKRDSDHLSTVSTKGRKGKAAQPLVQFCSKFAGLSSRGAFRRLLVQTLQEKYNLCFKAFQAINCATHPGMRIFFGNLYSISLPISAYTLLATELQDDTSLLVCVTTYLAVMLIRRRLARGAWASRCRWSASAQGFDCWRPGRGGKMGSGVNEPSRGRVPGSEQHSINLPSSATVKWVTYRPESSYGGPKG